MKKLLILSGKGGTGKTTVAAAFSRLSQAKAIADCDVDAPNLHIVSSMKGKAEYTDFFGSEKAHIDNKKCTGCGVCMEHCRFNAIRKENLKCSINEFFCEGCGVCAYVCKNEAVSLSDDTAGRQAVYREDIVLSTAELKMGRGNSGKLVSAVKKEMIKAAPEAELAVIDGSPGIGCPVISSVNGVDLVLIVAEPSLSGASDLKRLLKTITTFGTKAAVCVNKWDVSPENTEAVEELCRVCDVPFAGKIPYDKTAYEAINSGRSIAEFDCPAKDAIIKVFNKTMSMF